MISASILRGIQFFLRISQTSDSIWWRIGNVATAMEVKSILGHCDIVMILWDFPEIIHVPEYMKEGRKKEKGMNNIVFVMASKFLCALGFLST